MKFENATEENLESFYKQCGTSKEAVKQDVDILRKWYQEQPHLPQLELKDQIFRAFLLRNKFSLQRSKQTLDMYFTLKSSIPELYENRDPYRSDIQKSFDVGTFVPMPGITHEGYRILIFKVDAKDPADYDDQVLWKRALMMKDNMLFNQEEMSLGLIAIVDYENFKLGHFKTMNFPQLKRIEVCIKQSYRIRVRAIHFVNPPAFITTVMSLFKTFLRNKLGARMHVHQTLESLHEHVDKKLLPLDYGGEERKLSELASEVKKELEESRDWFLGPEANSRVDETKRPGKSFDSNELFGIEGSFKKLDVD